MRVIESETEAVVKSRVAVLGTLAELHTEPIQYDLKMLRRLVKDLHPDLLCAEIHPDDWQAGDLSTTSLEYREVLVPLSQQTDIVIVPVCGAKERGLMVPHGGHWLGLRRLIVRWLNSTLRWLQRLANGPEAINSYWFLVACHIICFLIGGLSGPEARRAWEEANQSILINILASVRRDPGRRILVTVDCRRSPFLIRDLQHMPEVELVDYHRL